MGTNKNTVLGFGFAIAALGCLFCAISMLPLPSADDAALHQEIQSDHSYAILQLRRVQLDALAEPAFQILSGIGLATYLGLFISLILLTGSKPDLLKISVSCLAPLAIVRFG